VKPPSSRGPIHRALIYPYTKKGAMALHSHSTKPANNASQVAG
jgi:hypothetical protein